MRLFVSLIFAAGFALGAPVASLAQNAPDNGGQNAPSTAPAQNATGVGAATTATLANQVDVPVLVSPKRINDEIRADDLTIKQFPTDKIRSDILLDTNNIIGLAAKRVLNAGTPLRAIDLRKTQLVQRGDLIDIIYKNDGMEIRATGKAQDGGALDESIRVVNSSSNRTISATISGPKQVTVKE